MPADVISWHQCVTCSFGTFKAPIRLVEVVVLLFEYCLQLTTSIWIWFVVCKELCSLQQSCIEKNYELGNGLLAKKQQQIIGNLVRLLLLSFLSVWYKMGTRTLIFDIVVKALSVYHEVKGRLFSRHSSKCELSSKRKCNDIYDTVNINFFKIIIPVEQRSCMILLIHGVASPWPLLQQVKSFEHVAVAWLTCYMLCCRAAL